MLRDDLWQGAGVLGMNTLLVQTEVSTREGSSGQKLWTEILVDNEPLVDFARYWLAVDLQQLALSLGGDGEYYVITCVCGAAGCAGIWRGIEVHHDAGRVHWTVRGLEPVRTFVFDGRAYQEAIQEGLRQFEQLQVQHRRLDVIPFQNRYLHKEWARIEAQLAERAAPKLETARYVDQAPLWPAEGRHILAHYDETSIVVYQAFRPEIGAYAVEHQQLGGGFKFRRMSWIKPSFLWMMYRSRWGSKLGQEMVLAVRIKRNFFDRVLALAVPSEYDADLYPDRQAWREAVKTSSVRVQWDPDRGPEGAVVGEEPRLKRRAIQLGLRGPVLREYASSAIMEIIDLSTFVEAQRVHLWMRNYEALSLPWQGVYVPADREIRDRLKLATL